jgi:hypothetical protein
MNRITSEPSLEHVDLVLGSFDQPVNCPDNQRVECHLITGTTWTTGRNALVKKAYQREKRLGVKYDYWTMSDADIVLICRSVAGAPLATTPSGCFAEYDRYVQDALGPVVVIHGAGFINTEQDPTLAMGFQESFDAAWNTVHRDAIPVVMPYYADLDPVTWWSSQAIFWYRIQCFKPSFASTPLSMFYHNPDHNPYPQNPRRFDAERQIGVQHLYELAGQIALPPLDYPDQIRNEKIRPVAAIGNTGDWKQEPLFLQCAAAFSHRFTQWVESP